MAPRKNVSRRGNYRSGPKAKRQSLNNSIASFSKCLANKADYDGSSLHDEITGARGNRAQWHFNKKFTHTKISFVSGGFLERYEPEKIVTQSKSKVPKSSQATIKTKAKVVNNPTTPVKLLTKDHVSSEQVNLPDFIIDLQGSGFVETGFSSPRLGSISPAPSCSSDEIILFKGRKNFNSNENTISSDSLGPSKTPDSLESKKIENVIPIKNNTNEKVVGQPSDILDTVQTGILQSDHAKGDMISHLHEDIAVDYLENTDSLDLNTMISFSKRDIGGNWKYECKNEKLSSYNPNGTDLTGLTWKSLYKNHCGPEVPSSSLNRRKQDLNNSSKQQQEVPKNNTGITSGLTPNDVSTTSCVNNSDVSIQLEIEVAERSENDSSEPEELSSIYDPDLDLDIDEGRYDYLDLIYDSDSDSDSDEDIGIDLLLAKHEEREMSSKNDIIYDNIPLIENDYKMRSPSSISCQIPNISVKSKKKNKKKEKKKEKKNAKKDKNTEAMNYVINDLHRLNFHDIENSRSKKNKALNEDDVSNSSDTNIEDFLNGLFENDRLKKSERKKQREALRANGMLGQKNKKPDIKSVYKDVMSMKALKKEMEIFLKSKQNSLALPPMPKKDRKFVHGIANLVKLRSKSVGNGHHRFTILFRTNHTRFSAKEAFEFMESNPGSREFPRQNKSKKTKFRKYSNIPKTIESCINYQDGDIVGASAPELAADNRGRAILEKMGWSSGTALGALENKGRLQPVSQVIKTTKAGLK